jgi:dTDP-4-dehydrorhamnose reductase
MRILITGAQGQLGHALQQTLSGKDLILKDLPDFDLTHADSEAQIIAAHPAVILHVGGYTDVDGAEREPDRALAVNAQGTALVARAAATLNARLIYVSTDYVFDGTKATPYREEDAPHPINVYGQSKHEGEIAALTGCPDTLVVRTAWLYGHAENNFVKTIIRLANEKPFLEVVGDQRGCPTNAKDLALALNDLLASDLRGICHVTNTGDCTWHEFAEAIVRLMDLSTQVRPITTAQAGRLARRPAYSVLAQGRLSTVRASLSPWQDALGRFMSHVSRFASTAK